MSSKLARIPPHTLSDVNPIRAARRIRGAGQWQSWSRTVNWLTHIGSTLVAAGPCATPIAPGDSLTFHLYLWQHEQNDNRIWVVDLATTGTGQAAGTFEVPSGSAVGVWGLAPIGARTQSYLFREVVGSPTASPGSIAVKVTNSAGSLASVYVEGISCYELPRFRTVVTAAGESPEDSSLGAKQPIFQDDDDRLSLNAVAQATARAPTEARRACLFSECFPAGILITDTSDPGGEETDPLDEGGASNVFARDLIIQPRCLYRNETFRAVSFAVRASIASGSGTVRLRSDILDTTDITITGSSPAWYTDTVLCKTEDPTQRAVDGGLRGNDLGLVRVTAWGAANPTVYSVCAGEYPL